MPKYIAIDRSLQIRSRGSLSSEYQNTRDSILATLDCRSHKRAVEIASQALKIPELSIKLYRTLPAAEKEWADQVMVLNVPEDDRPTGNPVGGVKKGTMLSIKTWVAPEVAERYQSIEHKSAWVADAIAMKMGMES
jgi:hypothetical protein